MRMENKGKISYHDCNMRAPCDHAEQKNKIKKIKKTLDILNPLFYIIIKKIELD